MITYMTTPVWLPEFTIISAISAQSDLLIDEYADNQPVHCRYRRCFRWREDSGIDSSQDDDRHHKSPDRILKGSPSFFSTGLGHLF